MASINRSPILGRISKLNVGESYTDQKKTSLDENVKEGSRKLLAAILATKKLYRPMTRQEIKEARNYAEGKED